MLLLAFDVNFWGTVSDWVMVIVTFITAGLLIWTFRDQQLLKKIEQIRYMDSIKPYFDVEVLHPIYDRSPPLFTAELSFLITNKNTLAEDVTLTITSTYDKWNFFHEDGVTEVKFPFRNIGIGMRLFHAKYYGNAPRTSCVFLLSYHDNVGNNYQQGLVYEFNDGKEFVRSSIPVLIGERILKV